MAKKQTPASTDYVNDAITQATEPMQEQIDELRNQIASVTAPPASEPEETVPPTYIYRRNDNPDLEEDEESYGIMDDDEYLFQVYPDLPRWLTKSPDEHLQMVMDKYRDQAIGMLMVDETRREFQRFAEDFQPVLDNHISKNIDSWKAESDRRLQQTDARLKKMEETCDHVNQTTEDLDAYYRKAVQLETLKERRSGLFFFGRHLLPLWFVILATSVLLICGYFTITFAAEVQETNRALQQELLQLLH